MRAGFVAPRYLRGGLIGAGGVGVILALAGINTMARGPLVLLFLVAAPTLAMAYCAASTAAPGTPPP